MRSPQRAGAEVVVPEPEDRVLACGRLGQPRDLQHERRRQWAHAPHVQWRCGYGSCVWL